MPLHALRKLLQVADALGVLAVVGVVSLAQDEHHQLVAVDLHSNVSPMHTASARGGGCVSGTTPSPLVSSLSISACSFFSSSYLMRLRETN